MNSRHLSLLAALIAMGGLLDGCDRKPSNSTTMPPATSPQPSTPPPGTPPETPPPNTTPPSPMPPTTPGPTMPSPTPGQPGQPNQPGGPTDSTPRTTPDSGGSTPRSPSGARLIIEPPNLGSRVPAIARTVVPDETAAGPCPVSFLWGTQGPPRKGQDG